MSQIYLPPVFNIIFHTTHAGLSKVFRRKSVQISQFTFQRKVTGKDQTLLCKCLTFGALHKREQISIILTPVTSYELKSQRARDQLRVPRVNTFQRLFDIVTGEFQAPPKSREKTEYSAAYQQE